MAATTSTGTGRLPLTPGRVTVLIVGVPIALALIAASGFSTLALFAQGRYAVSYTAPGITKTLVVNGSEGTLEMKPTAADRVTLNGTALYNFVRPTPTEHSAHGVTTIGYQCVIPIGNCGLSGTLGVPATVTTLTAHLGSGDATVTGTVGPVTLSTGSGTLSVSHATGPLALNTDDGNVIVNAIATAATVTASSGSGNIAADQVKAASVYANTDSGSVDASGVTAGTVTASSGSGSIDITFTGTPPRDISVNTDSGNVTLVLPAGAAPYHVSANTDSGQVTDNLHKNTSAPNTITASSGSGNITLTYG